MNCNMLRRQDLPSGVRPLQPVRDVMSAADANDMAIRFGKLEVFIFRISIFRIE